MTTLVADRFSVRRTAALARWNIIPHSCDTAPSPAFARLIFSLFALM